MTREELVSALKAAGTQSSGSYVFVLHQGQIGLIADIGANEALEECARHFDGSDYMMYRSEVAAAIRAMRRK